MEQSYEMAVKAAQGNIKSEKLLFTRLIDRFTCLAKLRGWGDEAEDIAQEACITIIEKLRLGDEVPKHFSAWTYGILRNKIGNCYQRAEVRGRYSVHDGDAEVLKSAKTFHPEPELKRSLENCMRELIKSNRMYARVVNLVFQGYEIEYISRKLATKPSNVYNILGRGRRLLKHCLKGKVHHQ